MSRDKTHAEREANIKRLRRMTTAELREELDSRLREELVREIEDLPDRLDRLLDKAATHIIMAACGVVGDGWGKWRLDERNEAPLMVELQQLVAARVMSEIPAFVAGLAGNNPKLAHVQNLYRAEYKRQFAELVDSRLTEIAHEAARKTVEAVEHDLLKELAAKP